MNFSFFHCLAAPRTRSSTWDTLPRSCARRMRCWSAFPSAPALRSTGSAADCPALFVGFLATMTGSDFSCPCISGYGSSPSRCGPAMDCRWPDRRPPGSRTRSVCTCQGLRPRRAVRALALARPSYCLPRSETRRHPGLNFFRGSMAGLYPPLPTLRRHPHGCRRTARGRGGSLRLPRGGLAPPTPCRSPGALRVSLS
jgi:hypothetical protein